MNMKKIIYLHFFFVFSFPAFSIEINDDMFIEPDSDMEPVRIIEERLQNPHIKQVRKIKKEVIKIKPSHLNNVVQSIDREQKQESDDVVLDQNSRREQRKPASKEKSSHSLDYGDYEVHWSDGDK